MLFINICKHYITSDYHTCHGKNLNGQNLFLFTMVWFISIAIVVLILISLVIYSVKPLISKNIFIPSGASGKHDSEFIVGDDDICKRFTPKKVPKNLDMIILGSGMSGVTLGALMAKAGKKVLILEQHDVAGGMMHTFKKEDYEFDTGLHYLGNMDPLKTPDYVLFDAITEGRIQWERLGKSIENLNLKEYSNDKFLSVIQSYEELSKLFPEEKDALKRLFEKAEKVNRLADLFHTGRLLKIFPSVVFRFAGWFVMKFLVSTKVLNQTTEELWKECGIKDQVLMDLLSFNISFNTGLPPSRLSFRVWASMIYHYGEGGWYPIGGASAFTKAIIPTIKKSGGDLLVGAEVTEILMDKTNTAIGVKIRGKHEILAPIVVSSIGIHNTYSRLFPNPPPAVTDLLRESESDLIPSASHFSVFVGLDVSSDELKKYNLNYWYYGQNVEKEWENVISEKDYVTPESAALTFSSVKDPTFTARCPGKATAQIVIPFSWSWVKKFGHAKPDSGSLEYIQFKEEVAEKFIKIFSDRFPEPFKHMDQYWTGSPLTQEYYFKSREGGSYGIESSKIRMNWKLTSPKSAIKNLYFTGADVLSHGVIGASFSSVFVACALLKRNLFGDLNAAHKLHLKKKA